MFQNISRDFSQEDVNQEVNNINKKNKLKKMFSIPNIIIYILSFMISIVGLNTDNIIFSISPFAIAFIAALLSNNMPIGIVYIITLAGTFIKYGTSNLITYVLTSLLFFVLVLIKRPKLQEYVNEVKRVGLHLFMAVLLIQLSRILYTNFYVYDVLSSIMLSVSTYVFYKIFANSIPMIRDLGIKKVFSIEEVIGTSLLISICACAFGEFRVFGYSIKNIISILIVLVLGWKNGMLVGATSGITIGVVLGIIGGNEPIMIAAYAISGMIAGIFNKLGKIGVIIGFILGNILLEYISNGNTVQIIMFQEILIASLGLLAVPKTIKLDIQDLFGKTKLLPEASGIELEENKETILKLNSMSETILDLAKSYGEAASTIVDEKELEEQELSNEQIFIDELKQNLINHEQNILYDTIYNNDENILFDIFKILLKEEVIVEKQLISVLETHNNYIVGFKEKNNPVSEDISQMIKAINYSYRISKLNFIWKKKMDESKKNVSSQLEGVSQAISDLADEIKNTKKEDFIQEKEQIKEILEEKQIHINAVEIKKLKSGRCLVDIYLPICDDIEGKKCDIKKIGKALDKLFNEKFIIQDQECGLRINKKECKFTYMSEDKYKLQIGMSKCTKAGSPVSGDSSIQTKLQDGKYLLAISDGMGSGPEAMKSSKIAIKMLERLLKAGFDKEVSLKLINSTLVANAKEDMYATLDIEILDLYAGNMEFIKNGASPTYLKRGKNVEVLKSVTLPTGIIENIDLVVYDCDLEKGDIIVMCSDGVIDSNNEYINKELWIKYLLEEMQTEDAQKIADIILNEAIDNDYGTQKDDMTIIVAKII